MSSPVISAVGLSKVYRDFWRRARVQAVRDLDFEVHAGEIFGLLGPNGSGKSTTIKMLLGLLHPTRGRIAVFGQPASDVNVKSRIGYLPEESYLYRFLNARETLHFYGRLFQIPRAERNKRIEELLEMVGLRSAARRPVGEYSKGMQRRIGLAQALINDPDLLILDEPTSGLDPIGSRLVKEIIVRVGTVMKKTILLSSHLLADVEEVCQRVTILYGGRVQVSGTMDQVLARNDQMQLDVAALRPDTLAEVQRVIREREGKSFQVSTPRVRLEELFLRVVREAHESRVETGGAAQAGAIAGFLGKSGEGDDVLSQLTRAAEPVPAKPEPVAVPSGPSRSERVLTDLVDGGPPQKPAPSAAAPEPVAPKPAANVDRGVLTDLLGGDDVNKGGGA
ncbi:MAG: ABC transporter ATP-binding protein [Phycisphaerae bacterium]|nr:ABC transporter ATP-binding protein [Phycisphaerae bacterium]